ncbi:unnamed protein product [Caenorhabditis auriculariae]|uniref:Uncharacterized protein n=1 Tax=Caenorhabditis auriculariae TaxID=2777116 RepID=A0A8S1HRN4_9PELO|nr:unnamed protein product [Caenorhabditis auriculariae]
MTMCPKCRTMIYDEEIMAGWKVDDQNLNTVCPHCCDESSEEAFPPRLTVRMRYRPLPVNSWYTPGGLPTSQQNTPEKTISEELPSISVAFVSPLVLRRELETLLSVDRDALKESSLMDSHPIVFWNLIYYMRRLALPTHLYSWITPRHHIRCAYDIPSEHVDVAPLYFLNPNNPYHTTAKIAPSLNAWNSVTTSVENNQLFKAIQTLINESRKVTSQGQVTVGPHFPIFRDIQFASLDLIRASPPPGQPRQPVRHGVQQTAAENRRDPPDAGPPVVPSHPRLPKSLHAIGPRLVLPPLSVPILYHTWPFF